MYCLAGGCSKAWRNSLEAGEKTLRGTYTMYTCMEVSHTLYPINVCDYYMSIKNKIKLKRWGMGKEIENSGVEGTHLLRR